jgi:hypothetical protein
VRVHLSVASVRVHLSVASVRVHLSVASVRVHVSVACMRWCVLVSFQRGAEAVSRVRCMFTRVCSATDYPLIPCPLIIPSHTLSSHHTPSYVFCVLCSVCSALCALCALLCVLCVPTPCPHRPSPLAAETSSPAFGLIPNKHAWVASEPVSAEAAGVRRSCLSVCWCWHQKQPQGRHQPAYWPLTGLAGRGLGPGAGLTRSRRRSVSPAPAASCSGSGLVSAVPRGAEEK